MPVRSDTERILAANRYLVLGTADQTGLPWVSPLFFAPVGPDLLVWVSSSESRHSRNIAHRAAVAVTVYDSTVAVGRAEAAYFEAEATRSPSKDVDAALRALNRRLPPDKQLDASDLRPTGPLAVYRAAVRRRYVLVRGGDLEHGNVVDMTFEV